MAAYQRTLWWSSFKQKQVQTRGHIKYILRWPIYLLTRHDRQKYPPENADWLKLVTIHRKWRHVWHSQVYASWCMISKQNSICVLSITLWCYDIIFQCILDGWQCPQSRSTQRTEKKTWQVWWRCYFIEKALPVSYARHIYVLGVFYYRYFGYS